MKIDEYRIDKAKKLLSELDILKCDLCGIVIGMVYESDLNGSYFLCDFCYKNRVDILEEEIKIIKKEKK